MSDKKVSIIILNYNGLDFLKACIPTVQKQTYKNTEIIVVDNHSSDGSREYAKTLADVLVIENSDNYGYAKANNIAAQAASGEFLLFVNNDTELFPDMIEKLAQNYKAQSILAPAQILFTNRESDCIGAAGNGMDIFGYPYADQDPKKTKTFYVDGAGIFIKKEDFIAIGMFDEELFIFQEDIDLSWRAQMMGYAIVPCWDAKYYHYSGGVVIGGGYKNKRYETSYFRRYLNEKNILRNTLKNYSIPLCLLVLPTILLIHVAEIFILALTGNGKAAVCYLKAYWWNTTNIKSTLAFRKQVQSNRIHSDIDLMKRMYYAYSKLTSFVRIGFPQFK